MIWAILVLCFVHSVIAASNPHFKDVADLQEFRACEENDFNADGIKIKPVGLGEAELDGFVEFKNEIKNISLFHVQIEKCKSKSELETCEQMTSIPFRNPWRMLTQKGQIWSSIIQQAKPPLVFPLNGKYDLTGAKVEVEKLKRFLPSTVGSFWRLTCHIFDENNKDRGCVRVSLAIIQVRIRNKN